MTKPVLALAALLCGALLALASHPAWDLDVARLSYAGHGRFVGDTPVGVALRYVLWGLPFVLFAASALATLAAEVGLIAKTLAPTRRGLAFLTLSLVLGPGLIVHGTLKPMMHRPRPTAVTRFGGTAAFEPFTSHEGGCRDDCSFPSGEAALASWTLAPASLVPPPWRGPALAGAILFTAVTSLWRMALGAHFLSDVTAATLIVLLVVFGLRAPLVGSPRAGPDEPHESARTP